MRTPSDAITHFLNYKDVIAVLFPLIPLLSFFLLPLSFIISVKTREEWSASPGSFITFKINRWIS